MTDSWATLFKTFQKLQNLMQEEFKRLNLPDMEVYDVLWTLEKSENHSLRLNELGEQVVMAKFNITRICKRLEESGLIERVKCPSDKRGIHAKLTKKGRDLRLKTWKVYSQLIEENFSSKLTANDHKNLILILRKTGFSN